MQELAAQERTLEQLRAILKSFSLRPPAFELLLPVVIDLTECQVRIDLLRRLLADPNHSV